MNEINLLPDDYIRAKRTKPKRILKTTGIILAVAAIILFSYNIFHRYQGLKAVTVQADKIYEEDLTPLLEKEQSLKQIQTDINGKYDLYLELSGQKILWSEMLLEIAQLTPKNIQIKNVVINDNENIILAGEALSDTDIAQFMVNLGKSPKFKDVDLNHITTELGPGGRDTLIFQITFSLKEKGGE